MLRDLRLSSVWSTLAVLSIGGCGPTAPSARDAADAIPIVGDATDQGYVSPAHWVFQPESAQAVFAHQQLDDGSCVLAGAGGHRYLTSAPGPDDEPCSGRVRVAAFPAPEDLVDMVHRSSAGWLFVGRSGALYEAETPLAAFHRRVLPPRPLIEVATGGSTLLAVTNSGELFRWDDDATWTPAITQGLTGKLGRVFDVAVDSQGHAIAVATPELILISDDDGKTFRPASSLPKPPGLLGTLRVGLSRNGQLVIETATGPQTWRGGQAPFEPSKRSIAESSSTGPLRPGPGRSITSLLDRSAALRGDRYYQVLRSEDHWDYEGSDKWLLVTGGLEGPLDTRVVDDEETCSEVFVGARGDVVVLGCMVDDGRDTRIHLRRSFDAGKTFDGVGHVELIDETFFSIDVAADGRALLTGVCVPDEDGVCAHGASVAVLSAPDAENESDEAAKRDKAAKDDKRDKAAKDDGAGALTQSKAPHAASQALMPAISPDGETMYFVARRTKDHHVSLFLSLDGGESFEPRPLEIPVLFSGREQGVVDLEEQGYDLVGELEIDGGALCIDEDGTLGLTLLEPEGYIYLTADVDGRVQRAARSPSHDATMAGCGSRVLSVGTPEPGDAPDDDSMHAWESLDGGATWMDLPATSALASAESMVCATAGCVIGNEISRVGWGGQRESASAHYGSNLPSNHVPAVGVPLVCELAADTTWKRIEHVHFTGDEGGLPPLSVMMRGDSVWSTLSFDSPKGAVIAISAQRRGPKKGKDKGVRLVHETMFSASKRSSTSTRVLLQMEGYAAYRVAVPSGDRPPPPGDRVGRIEIAWESYLEGISGRRTLPGSTRYEDISLKRRSSDWEAHLGLSSITPGGILVSPGCCPASPPRRSSSTRNRPARRSSIQIGRRSGSTVPSTATLRESAMPSSPRGTSTSLNAPVWRSLRARRRPLRSLPPRR